jgi:geranylgeranyl reductase family protein
MPLDADIIVVGAGPAGSTAAKLLASRGYEVLLIDRAGFPRHKTCASWINRLAFERFPYLMARLDELVEAPFYGITFYDSSLERSGRFTESAPSGYLSLRSKFDDGLRRIAVEAGAEFVGGRRVEDVSEGRDDVRVRLADGAEFSARVVIGADGASSRVAAAADLHRGWGPRDYVLCANADAPCPPALIETFYGSRFPLVTYLQYEGLQGYGWVFPKRQHVCIGIGAMLGQGREIRSLFERFVRDLHQRRHLPAEIPEASVKAATTFDLDPVGAVHRLPSLTRGRVLLIGDAAGFVSGSTGEGIYPGMVSAEIACEVVDRALRTSQRSPAEALARFDRAWRLELAGYVKRLPGGEQEGRTKRRIDLIFRSPLAARVAGRVFLYGEGLTVRTLARCVWYN